jgi:glyoxylase-like metal-dependent hydrolase (beta-lactamase superfamily II)
MEYSPRIMTMRDSRRRFLGGVIAGAACATLPPALRPALAAPRPALAAQRLANGLLLVSGAGGNALFLRGPDGLLAVDGGHRNHAAALLRQIRRDLGTDRVSTLIDTHWHPDHTGLNERVGAAGGKIIAHENTRLWLSTKVRYEPDAAPIGPLPKAAQPNATTRTTGEIDWGDETVRYGYLPQAHTDGDLYVKFERANVLATGGVIAGNGWPTADWVTGGWINGTAAACRTLAGLCDERTRVVTGYGAALLGRADLEADGAMLAKLGDQLAKMLRAGFGPADVLAVAPAKDYEPKYGDSTQFLTQSFRGLWPRFAPDA